MEYQAFTEGVRKGSVTTSHEVIILICYMVSKAEQPVSLGQLGRALLREELVNYFEFTNASEYLIKSGHLLPCGDEATEEDRRYRISELGAATAKTFEADLPTAVRDRATAALQDVLKLVRREEENRVEVEKVADGYQISMTITDIGTDLMSIRMFMPHTEECEMIRRRFLNDPLTVYKGVFALLTGDMETVGKLLPNNEDLFDPS